MRTAGELIRALIPRWYPNGYELNLAVAALRREVPSHKNWYAAAAALLADREKALHSEKTQL